MKDSTGHEVHDYWNDPPDNTPDPRYTVEKTDYHWDPCWGVFDNLKSTWIMKEVGQKGKSACIKKAQQLNDEG